MTFCLVALPHGINYLLLQRFLLMRILLKFDSPSISGIVTTAFDFLHVKLSKSSPKFSLDGFHPSLPRTASTSLSLEQLPRVSPSNSFHVSLPQTASTSLPIKRLPRLSPSTASTIPSISYPFAVHPHPIRPNLHSLPPYSTHQRMTNMHGSNSTRPNRTRRPHIRSILLQCSLEIGSTSRRFELVMPSIETQMQMQTKCDTTPSQFKSHNTMKSYHPMWCPFLSSLESIPSILF